MYIAITRKRYKDIYHEQILLRESYREDGKVKTRTIANLTKQPKHQVEAIASALKNKDEPIVTTKNQQQGSSVGFSMIVIFIMKLLGMFTAIGKTYESKIAIVLIAARIILQSSRLQALYWAKEDDKILDLIKFNQDEKDKLNERTIYLGLDYIYENQERIEDKLFKAYYGNKPPKRVFYDVTSTYVEGDYKNSELVAYGYNRDGKKNKAQIVIGLLTDEDGHAISIHTYKGNTNDVATFADQLEKLKNRFKLKNITVVGDGGMIKSEDIYKIRELGYEYITSIGKPSIQKLINDKNIKIDMSLFDENLREIIENDIRYILRQNPMKRDEIRQTRDDNLIRLETFINDKSNYYNTHYRAKNETLTKYIDKKISNLRLTKFTSYKITYKDGNCEVKDKNGNTIAKTKPLATIEIIIDERAKNQVQELDGCYIIKTSLIDNKENSKEDIHKAYKTLIKVENAFKTLKTDYLEIRPLYLKTDKRIKGHVALSMLSYNIVLKLREYIKLSNLDFKSTLRQLASIKTVKNVINQLIVFETIPGVSDNLKVLFSQMKFKLPAKI